jgi:4-alpha-glucanotransferase
LDPTAVPEFHQSAQARKLWQSPEFQAELTRLRSSTRIAYADVLNAKIRVFRLLHDVFLRRHADGRSPRGREYRRYLAREGDELTRFATFLALEERFARKNGTHRPWPTWPAAFRDPLSPEVTRFCDEHHLAVDFHRYLQFELDRQLLSVTRFIKRFGMRIGLFNDLALGCARDGSDVWANQNLFARGASLGAPPDTYAPQGQNWNLPPLNPHKLQEDGYRLWAGLLRNACEHAGGLRIDHMMGLLRQFWIPEGAPASAGAYVRFPWNDLVGILALQAVRHGCLVVGEDLGTVPAGFSRRLAERNILSNRLFFFEKNLDGSFKPPSRYTPRALVTATNHDFGPLAGFWSGRDLVLRRRLGLIQGQKAWYHALRSREAEKRHLLRTLKQSLTNLTRVSELTSILASLVEKPPSRRPTEERRHLVKERQGLRPVGTIENSPAFQGWEWDQRINPSPVGTTERLTGVPTGLGTSSLLFPSNDAQGLARSLSPAQTAQQAWLPLSALGSALHAFLLRTPAWLIGVMLDDLTGETEPVNVPGVANDRYPNWSRPMSLTLEEIRTSPGRIPSGVARSK